MSHSNKNLSSHSIHNITHTTHVTAKNSLTSRCKMIARALKTTATSPHPHSHTHTLAHTPNHSHNHSHREPCNQTTAVWQHIYVRMWHASSFAIVVGRF